MSIADEIEKLGNLRKEGILSEEEFQVQKARILHQPAEVATGGAVGMPAFINNPSLSDKAAEHAAIRSEVKRLNNWSLLLGLSGLVVQGYGSVTDQTLYKALGALLLVAGLAVYAKMRGRHPALGLLGLLSCVGMLILFLLDKNCLSCGRASARNEDFCADCGAPLGS